MLTGDMLRPGWASLPREPLIQLFSTLPLHDRSLTIGAVCSWWRSVSLDHISDLLLDLNLNRVPLFAQRTRSLPDLYQQQASFAAWLLRRSDGIRRLSLTTERWQDDDQAVMLRLVVARVVGPCLQFLRLVCTDSGRATSAFLSVGTRLRELQLDYWGRSNRLPAALAACTALSKLSVQCSGGLEHCQALSSLASLQDLSICDCNWQSIPDVLLRLPLTRLHLRFADLSGAGWLPADAAHLAASLQELSLPGCQICTVPWQLAQLTALTALVLDRNYFRHLPTSLSSLSHLQMLSCEGCSGLMELPAALAATLPLRSLNLQYSGVLRLPVPPAGRPVNGAAGASGSGYMQHLTELHWGIAEWEEPRHAEPASVAAAGERRPDLLPLLQAPCLRVVRLSHLPADSQPQVELLRQRLQQLRRLVVNSAVLVE